ncbi:glycosyltransferase [Tanticharoenia sakaeratensis]|uniref:Glycosyl transferase n=1 Tax=Tanticharoenia sakaeratensis NBRC 103193 TaxID=1231623 RepID=A0A0D6MNY8_9PROT|nr:glycosyltransferase [Tanticharoenia sakaeratensis]GAN55003.1 glycosyl transferase [Tanticharoenia sakaeratensis NBRC 103193]GBQ20406.1 glycosyltransferase [Tanticharoenia sakaeratensis NBRC 103193]
MRYLFVHQNFPGQFLHILRRLHEEGEHDIVFISEANQGSLPGVRRVLYKPSKRSGADAYPAVREIELAALRADGVAQSARTLKQLGYEPDIIIGHHGWGELLNLGDVFPKSPILGYYEFFYHTDRNDVGFDPEFPLRPEAMPQVRLKNTVNFMALSQPGFGQTPTLFQRDTYPEWAHDRLTLLREGVNLDLCAPKLELGRRSLTIGAMSIAPKRKLVTYVSRDLEPYRGFHTFMRALPRLLEARPDVDVALVGGDGVSYGARAPGGATWRATLIEELRGSLDLSRVHFLGRVTYDDFRALLQRSDAHVYLTYPFVASWSLREAMACGCAIVGSRTAPVEEFITDGETGRLVPFLEPDAIADGILELLEDRTLARRLRRNARRWAEAELSLDDYLDRYKDLIARITGS